MKIGAQTWFYWPATVCLYAVAVGAHLYHRAAGNGRPALASAFGGVAALALPIVPLALSTRARCNDTGQRTFFEPNWVILAAGIAAWVLALWVLYRVAGDPPEAASRATALITVATLVGFWLEFVVSQISLMTYCNDTVPALRWVHLGAAVAVLLLGAAVAALWARSSSSFGLR